MRVLILDEPWATLIKNKKKYIETRSWKTNYRRELYIHAGKKIIDKATKSRLDLMNLVKDDKMNYSKIVCKCELVDCIYMTEEYIKKTKTEEPQQFICGEYAVGRYACILTNIEPIENDKLVSGEPGIWTYDLND